MGNNSIITTVTCFSQSNMIKNKTKTIFTYYLVSTAYIFKIKMLPSLINLLLLMSSSTSACA